MRHTFSELVEQGRELTGFYATERGDRAGRFTLTRYPMTKKFCVVVSDGEFWHEMLPGPKWEHVSVSLLDRCPTWEEMCWIKSLFFEPEEVVIQFHPPESKYVNQHRFCLHLWRLVEGEIPLPPTQTVGWKYGFPS